MRRVHRSILASTSVIAALTCTSPVAAQPMDGSLDYPAEALKAGEEGTTRYRIDIDAKGVPHNCVILQSSKSEALDLATCKIVLSRLRFTPATNGLGQTVESTKEAGIIWKLPKSGPDGPESFIDPGQGFPVAVSMKLFRKIIASGRGASAKLDIDENGKLVGCQLVERTGLPEVDDRVCRIVRKLGRFGPAKDRLGRAKRVTMVQPISFGPR